MIIDPGGGLSIAKGAEVYGSGGAGPLAVLALWIGAVVRLDARRAGEEHMGVLAAAIRRIVASVDPNQPVSDVQPLAAIVDGETTARAVRVRVLGAFAALACPLAETTNASSPWRLPAE